MHAERGTRHVPCCIFLYMFMSNTYIFVLCLQGWILTNNIMNSLNQCGAVIRIINDLSFMA